MVAKLEKSELSIRLANKMDNMDRTWKWFSNPFYRMWIQKARAWPERVNGKVRVVIRISYRVVYYLFIATVAYITTRDGGDYFAESDLSNMETHVTPSFRYKLIWALIVFLVMSM